jgi:hypothetical protein
MIYKMNINTGMQETDDMVRAFIDELKYIEQGRSTMRGSQVYINMVDYVKKICDENNLELVNTNPEGGEFEDWEEEIINEVRGQFEYDFNMVERASDFMMEEKLDYLNIKWLENAYEYHKWECGFGCNVEAQLENKVNFIMYCIAKQYCIKWIEKEELDVSLF